MSSFAPYMIGVITGTVLTVMNVSDIFTSDTTFNMSIPDEALTAFKYDKGDFCSLFETFAKTIDKEVSEGNQSLELVRNEQTGACSLRGITP